MALCRGETPAGKPCVCGLTQEKLEARRETRLTEDEKCTTEGCGHGLGLHPSVPLAVAAAAVPTGERYQATLQDVAWSGVREVIVKEATAQGALGSITWVAPADEAESGSVHIDITFRDAINVTFFRQKLPAILRPFGLGLDNVQGQSITPAPYDVRALPVVEYVQRSPHLHSKAVLECRQTATPVSSSPSTPASSSASSGRSYISPSRKARLPKLERGIREIYDVAHLVPRRGFVWSLPTLTAGRAALHINDDDMNLIKLSPTVHRLFDGNNGRPRFYFDWRWSQSNECFVHLWLKFDPFLDDDDVQDMQEAFPSGMIVLRHRSSEEAIRRCIYLGLRRQWCEHRWNAVTPYMAVNDERLRDYITTPISTTNRDEIAGAHADGDADAAPDFVMGDELEDN